MVISLQDESGIFEGDDRRLKVVNEDFPNKVRLIIADNSDTSMCVLVDIDDLRKALSAIKALK